MTKDEDDRAVNESWEINVCEASTARPEEHRWYVEFRIGSQSFRLDYHAPEDEANWMASQLDVAFRKILASRDADVERARIEERENILAIVKGMPSLPRDLDPELVYWNTLADVEAAIRARGDAQP